MSHSSIDFNRWDGPRHGVWARRAVITSTGLRQLLRMRVFKILLFVGWAAALAVAAAGFVFAQTMAEGGWLANLATSAGPRPAAMMKALSAMLLVFPDILVTGGFKGIFWVHSQVGLLLSLAAMTLLVPQLITRDRASQALTIYLARPLTSRDYLLGKLGIIAGVLLLLWTGPLLAGWGLSMLLVPDSIFLSHSLPALGAALLFNLIAMVVVGAIAFGVSALGRTAATARLGWIGLWIVLSIVANAGPRLPGWVRHASFSYDLRMVRDEVFAMNETLTDAAAVVPMLNRELARELNDAATQVGTDEIGGVVTGLCVLVGGSMLVLLGRVKPE